MIAKYLGGCFLCLTVAGCAAGADWTNVQAASGYNPPKTVEIDVITRANGEGLPDATQALVTELKQDLADKGITATVVTTDAPPPLAQVTIVKWNPGSRAARYFAGSFGAGEADMNVHVVIVPAPGAPAFQGDVQGYVKGGWFGGSSDGAGEEAGEAIAEAIATGKAKD